MFFNKCQLKSNFALYVLFEYNWAEPYTELDVAIIV